MSLFLIVLVWLGVSVVITPVVGTLLSNLGAQAPRAPRAPQVSGVNRSSIRLRSTRTTSTRTTPATSRGA